MLLERTHATGGRCTKALLWIDHDQLVNKITAGRVHLHRTGPLYFAIVDLGEDSVALRACEGHIASIHFKDDVSERPEICCQRCLL